MVKGRIWGTVCGKYREIEIDECDVIMAIGLKVPDKNGMVDSQATALGYGLTKRRFCYIGCRRCGPVGFKSGGFPRGEKGSGTSAGK